MSERPVERSSSISDRRIVSSTPSGAKAPRFVVADSSTKSPETAWSHAWWRSETAIKSGATSRLGSRISDQEGIGGSAGDSRQVGADAMALALPLVTGLAVPCKDRSTTTVRHNRLHGAADSPVRNASVELPGWRELGEPTVAVTRFQEVPSPSTRSRVSRVAASISPLGLIVDRSRAAITTSASQAARKAGQGRQKLTCRASRP